MILTKNVFVERAGEVHVEGLLVVQGKTNDTSREAEVI